MTIGADDHLARDRDELIDLMRREVLARAPAWRLDSIADLGVTLIELLASVGDRLAYEQDAVSTEAYIGRLRARRSAVRHARLLGLRVDEGGNARTWVRVHIAGGDDGHEHAAPPSAVVVPAGTRMLTRIAGQPGMLQPGDADELIAQHRPVVFETMRDLRVEPERAAMPLHGDHVGEVTLETGATRIDLCGRPPVLPGDVIALSSSDQPGDVHVVRIARATVSSTGRADQVADHEVTTLEWSSRDALPRSFTFTVDTADRDESERGCRSTGCAQGNLVLADHGESRTTPVTRDAATGELVIDVGDLVFAEPLGARRDPFGSAAGDLLQDDDLTLPALELVQDGRHWRAVRDLLASHPGARHVVPERTDDGRFTLRFGDGRAGAVPPPGGRFEAHLRQGGGHRGNIAADALHHVSVVDDVDLAPGYVLAVTNVVPAVGGRRPEPTELIRLRVPHVWSAVESCVTPDDVAERARQHPAVVAASARRGHVDAIGASLVELTVQVGRGSSSDVDAEIRAMLEPHRVIGQVIDIRRPVQVPLRVGLLIDREVDRTGTVADVRLAVADLFAPDRSVLGEPIHRSRLLGAVAAVPGVHAVEVTALARRDSESDAGDPIRLEPWELASLAPEDLVVAVSETMGVDAPAVGEVPR